MFRNLHPKFRHFLEGKSVGNFEDFGKLRVEYEKRRELDTRYLPPPPKGKSRIPAAAFRREESVVSAASLENKTDADARSRSSRTDRKKRKAEGANVTAGGGGNTAVDVRVDAFVPANASASEVPQQLHAGVDLGRPKAVRCRLHIPYLPTGTAGPRANTGNHEGSGFRGRCFVCKNVWHKQSECSLPVCYACGQPCHYANACPQGRRAPVNSQPTSAPSSVLASTEIGIVGCVGGKVDALHSQQSACSVYDRRERRALLREIKFSLDSEATIALNQIHRRRSG